MIFKIISNKLKNKFFIDFIKELNNQKENHSAIIYSEYNDNNLLLIIFVGNNCIFIEKHKSQSLNLKTLKFNLIDNPNQYWKIMLPRIKSNGIICKDSHLIEQLFEHIDKSKKYYNLSLKEQFNIWHLFFTDFIPKDFFNTNISYSKNIGHLLD